MMLGIFTLIEIDGFLKVSLVCVREMLKCPRFLGMSVTIFIPAACRLAKERVSLYSTLLVQDVLELPGRVVFCPLSSPQTMAICVCPYGVHRSLLLRIF